MLLPGNSGSTFHCGGVHLSDKAPGKPHAITSGEERRERELAMQKENSKIPEERRESEREKQKERNVITSSADPQASGLLIREVSHKLRDKQLRKLKMTCHYGHPLRGERGGR